jgi:molybdate transport system substrate-binding protein
MDRLRTDLPDSALVVPRSGRAAFISGAAGAALLLSAHRAAAEEPAIAVFAAASLRETFSPIALEFAKAAGTTVIFNFGGSDALATQILQGAPVAAFASANLAQMDRVKAAGLLAGAPRIFARNRIAVIVPASNPAKIAGPGGLANPGVKVVLAAPSVPAGSYARAALAEMSKEPSFGADFAARVEHNVVSNELDVKAVATKIALGEADAGIVYETDASGEIGARVHVLSIPPQFAKPAQYPAAAIKGAPPAGTNFVDFLFSGTARAIFRHAGFLPPTTA